MDTFKRQVLKKLDRKYLKVVSFIKEEGDLLDGCSHMIYFTKDYQMDNLHGSCYPVATVAEAVQAIKDTYNEKHC